MNPPVDTAISATDGSEQVLFAPTGELALFAAGAVLTIIVIAFVVWLLVSATREERAARAVRAAKARDDS
tara:strand:+ start:283 stop:492 length:210 start_codon:yes stop_codon:yes gene_type:complete